MLLAWHFSIQSAAHDAAIFQVRTWLNNLNASAGNIQFRLLRSALTVENIKADIDGYPLQIKSLFIKGNPASFTTLQPNIDQINIQGLSLDLKGLSPQVENLALTLPPTMQTILRQANHISITDGELIHVLDASPIFIQTLTVSGAPGLRKVQSQGIFKEGEHTDDWQLSHLWPEDVSTQSGTLKTTSAKDKREINWSGDWKQQNMKVSLSLNHEANDEASQASSGNSSMAASNKASGAAFDALFDAQFNQQGQSWQGDIQTQRWAIDLPQFKSLVSGNMKVEGTPSTWTLKSPNLDWEHTTFSGHEIDIQDMKTKDIQINNAEKKVQMNRLDINHATLGISTQSSYLFDTTWFWSIPNINLAQIDSAFKTSDQSLNIPQMNGTASVKNNQLRFDVSEQASEAEFWRLRTEYNSEISLSATHVPLNQIRELLPDILNNPNVTVDGKATLYLTTNPSQQWQTKGKIFVDDIIVQTKNQIFTAQTFEMNIDHADSHNIQVANIHASHWSLHLPLTPRQAWADTSAFDFWNVIPWQVNSIFLKQGEISIGSPDHVWFENAYVLVNNWQHQTGGKLDFSANMGFSPFKAEMKLRKNENGAMDWQTLEMNFKDTNMFFLEDWLRLSHLPYVTRGHFTIALQAQKEINNIKGHLDLALSGIQLSHDPARTDFLQEKLGYESLAFPSQITSLKSDFDSPNIWGVALGNALLVSAKESLDSAETKSFENTTTNLEPTYSRLGSIRIQQDAKLSLNERTRLRKIIKSITTPKLSNHAMIELVPDIGTANFTPKLRAQMIQTQALIRSFLSQRGIKQRQIYATLPEAKHVSISDISAVHINLSP